MSEITYRDCKYNSSKVADFVGYCNLPQFHTSRGIELVKCRKCPCEHFELKESDE